MLWHDSNDRIDSVFQRYLLSENPGVLFHTVFPEIVTEQQHIWISAGTLFFCSERPSEEGLHAKGSQDSRS